MFGKTHLDKRVVSINVHPGKKIHTKKKTEKLGCQTFPGSSGQGLQVLQTTNIAFTIKTQHCGPKRDSPLTSFTKLQK